MMITASAGSFVFNGGECCNHSPFLFGITYVSDFISSSFWLSMGLYKTNNKLRSYNLRQGLVIMGLRLLKACLGTGYRMFTWFLDIVYSKLPVNFSASIT